jgi:hypothetical protein
MPDWCQEMGRLTEEERITTQAVYDRPLTPQQEQIRAACRKSAARHIVGPDRYPPPVPPGLPYTLVLNWALLSKVTQGIRAAKR